MRHAYRVALITTMVAAGLAGSAVAQSKTGAYSHEAAEKLYRQAKYDDAIKMCKQAISDIEKSKGSKSPALAEPLIDLTTVYMRQAKYAEAKTLIERADSVLDKNKPDQALIYGRLGINKSWRLYTLGETEAAAKVCEEARDILQKHVTESKDLAEIINNLGLMYEEEADKQDDDPALLKKARRLLFDGWTMRRKLTGDISPESGESLNNLGMHLLFHSNSPRDAALAIDTLKTSLETAEKAYGKDHPETAVSHGTYALALSLQEKFDDAEKEDKIAIDMTKKYFGEMHPDMAYELSTLGHIQDATDHEDDAEKSYLKVIEINEAVFGKTSPQVIPSLKTLKAFYDDKKDSVKAREVQRRIEQISGKEI
jgi:tetratricopeptide (TPR) repeat protein